MSEAELIEVCIRSPAMFRCEKMRAILFLRECKRRQTSPAPVIRTNGKVRDYQWKRPYDAYCRSGACPQGREILVQLGAYDDHLS